MSVLNLRFLKHPLNWLTVWSMLFLMFYVFHLLLAYFNGRHPGDPSDSFSNASDNVAGPGTSVPA